MNGGYVIRILFNQMLDEKSFHERRRITINDVCEATGLSRPTLSRIANVPGYVTSTDTIERLCRYFGCTPGDLLALVDEEPEGQASK
jgi:putative transcriptional regulator